MLWRAITLLLLLAAPVAADEVGYRLIVHPENSVTAVQRRFVSDAFLKKVVEWPGGEIIRPVDLSEQSAVRRQFVEETLGRSISAVKRYWQQMIFSGRSLPPPELDSDEAVVRYVLRYKGAIGYVSIKANVGAAKVVQIH